MESKDERDCVTIEELALLFDDAFAHWSADEPDDDGRRQTPRVAVRDAKPIIAVSYTHEGKTIELDGAARIVDVSADGLGVLWPEQLPVGARVLFQLGGRDGDGGQGVATVARSTRQRDGFHIGLAFVDDAASLEDQTPGDAGDAVLVPARGWRGRYDFTRNAVLAVHRVVTRREGARRSVRRSMDGREALFVVEAKLFRFTAFLYIDGKKVASRTGMLNNRACNLFSDSVPPTMINLEGGDFSAWAVLRANAVPYCELDLSLRCKHRLCMKVLDGARPAPRGSQ